MRSRWPQLNRHSISIDIATVTLGPGRYRRRLDGSKDRPKGRPLGIQASRRMPEVQRFQRSIDSIVRRRLREVRSVER